MSLKTRTSTSCRTTTTRDAREPCIEVSCFRTTRDLTGKASRSTIREQSTRASSKTASATALDAESRARARSSKACSTKMRWMGLGSTTGRTAGCLRVSSRRVGSTALGSSSGPTARSMRVSSRTTTVEDRAFCSTLTVSGSKEDGKTAASMDEVCTTTLTAASSKWFTRMERKQARANSSQVRCRRISSRSSTRTSRRRLMRRWNYSGATESPSLPRNLLTKRMTLSTDRMTSWLDSRRWRRTIRWVTASCERQDQ